MANLKLELKIEDYQIIRNALMERKASEVYSLIALLDSQVVSQTQQEQAIIPMAQITQDKEQ